MLISIGMANTTQMVLAELGTAVRAMVVQGKAAADPSVNHYTLVIVNRCRGRSGRA